MHVVGAPAMSLTW